MIHNSTRKIEQAYRDSPAVSQSQLKLLLSNVGLFNNVVPDDKDNYYTEKTHFIIGSAVDTWITMGVDVMDQEYHISEMVKKPSASIMSIIQEVYDVLSGMRLDTFTEDTLAEEWVTETILAACSNQGYQKNWKADTKLSKILDEGQDYWNELVQSNGKQILSKDQYDLIKTIYDSLISHPHTTKYFKDAFNLDIYFQYPIYFTYKDVECRALLDMVIVDHTAKTIQPIDIKTMGDYTINFPISLYKRRYDIQAAFYTQALVNENVGNNSLDYFILPFKFMVESTTAPGKPLMYTCTNRLLLNRGKYGIPAVEIGTQGHYLKEILGFDDAIDLYKWHLENGFEEEKIIAQYNGDLLIDVNGIVK